MSQVAMTAATKCGLKILLHPSQYSPYMAPSDLYVFPKLKFHLLGTQYRINEGIKETVNESLGTRKGPSILKG